jgi:hypothetical protein
MKPTPIVRWPCDQRCHSRSVRAAYYRTHIYLHSLLIALVLTPAPLIAWWSFHERGLVKPVLIGSAALFALSWATRVFPLWRSTVFAWLHTCRWRRDWRHAEQSSAALRKLIQSPCPPSPRQIYEQLPNLPQVAWHLDDQADVNYDTRVIADATTAEAVYAKLRADALGLAAGELLRCSEHCVVGRGRYENLDSIVAVFALARNVQFWVIFQPRRIGNVLGFRAITGHQWWGLPGHTVQGRYSFGEVFHTKMRARALLVRRYRDLIVMFPIGTLVLLVGGLRQLFVPDVRRQFLFLADPRTGDSADVRLIGSLRAGRQGGFGVFLMGDALAEVKALKQQVIGRLQDLPQKLG